MTTTHDTKGLAATSRWQRAASAGLGFRVATDADVPFLFRVYASTRAQELAQVPWSEEHKAAFVAQQAHAQHVDYKRNYANADYLVIERAGEGIGRLYLDRRASLHSIIDIAFLPEHCGKGYGGALVADLLDEAAAAGKPMEIYVEKFNPAMRLYRRLGFVTVEEQGVYDLLRWTPVR